MITGFLKKLPAFPISFGLGNLVSRVLSVVEKIDINNEFLDSQEIENSQFQKEIKKTEDNIGVFLGKFEFNKALSSIWELISFCDQYIEKVRVWEKKEGQEKSILFLLYTISEITKILSPFLPKTSSKILSSINLERKDKKIFFNTKKIDSLFPKLN